MRIPSADASLVLPLPEGHHRDPLAPRPEEMPRTLPADPPPFPPSMSHTIKRLFGIEAYEQREASPDAKPTPELGAERKTVVA